MKRWLKTFLLLVIIFLIPTVWLTISHYHAKREVERYKAQLRAAGEKLTVDELLPPIVPPGKNSATLVLQAFDYPWFEGPVDSNPPPAMRMVAPGKAMIGWQQPYIVSDYISPPITNTWEDIEQDLEKSAPRRKLFQQAAALPDIDFGLNYRDFSPSMLNSNLAKMKYVALVLSAAAVSDLNHARTPAAITNVHTILAVVNQWRNERTAIAQLVRHSMTAIASGAQWEVLQATNLTDPELAMLQHDWESMEFIKSLEQALEMERARGLLGLQDLQTSNSPSVSAHILYDLPGSGGGSSNTTFWSLKDFGRAAERKTSDLLWRNSWSYHDELLTLQAHGIVIGTMRQVETNGFFEDALAKHDLKFSAFEPIAGNKGWLRLNLNDEFVRWFGDFGARPTTLERMRSLEATRRIVIVAIALKRYQLRHGSWPIDLKTLVPEFLSEVPRDPVDGLPLRYHTNADGTFTLYSVGADGLDGGGDPLPLRKTLYWLQAHDWVWPQPATPEETQRFYKKLQQPFPGNQ